MQERSSVSNSSRRVAQQLERDSRVLNVVPLDDIPQYETKDSDDERRENIRGRPGVLLASGEEGDDEERQRRYEDKVPVPTIRR